MIFMSQGCLAGYIKPRQPTRQPFILILTRVKDMLLMARWHTGKDTSLMAAEQISILTIAIASVINFQWRSQYPGSRGMITAVLPPISSRQILLFSEEEM